MLLKRSSVCSGMLVNLLRRDHALGHAVVLPRDLIRVLVQHVAKTLHKRNCVFQ